jgi:aryl carrier-like protein
VFEFICTTIREMAGQGLLPAHLQQVPLRPQDCLVDLGLDSLGQLTLLSELQARLDVAEQRDRIDGFTPLAELGHWLATASGSPAAVAS